MKISLKNYGWIPGDISEGMSWKCLYKFAKIPAKISEKVLAEFSEKSPNRFSDGMLGKTFETASGGILKRVS